jgi:endonuclease/exonuclease/phosphatase family metal-dependent hydrolase
MKLLLAITFLTCSGCAVTKRDRSRPPMLPVVQFVVQGGNAPRQSPVPDSVTVATYNVHGLRNAAGVRRDLAALNEIDVLCLQEVAYVDEEWLAAVLPAGRWYVAVAAVNRDPKTSKWEAHVIASRLPLENVEVWPIDEADVKRRVALAARVDVGGGRRVRVVNVDHQPSLIAWQDRNALQVRRLAERLGACDEEAVIVAGDFNCSGNLLRMRSNSAQVRQVDDALAGIGFSPVRATGPTFKSGIVHLRLDRIYVRGAAVVAGSIATTSRGSDHRPVWARIAIDGTAEKNRSR